MNTNLYVEPEPDGRLRLSGLCAVTGKKYSVVVPLEGAIAYFTRGAHIGEAFPELPREDREFLISGTSPEGWTRLFEGMKRRSTAHPKDKEKKRKERPEPGRGEDAECPVSNGFGQGEMA